MNRKIFLGSVFLLFAGMMYGQAFKDIYDKAITDNQKINYPYLREADVVWSKKIWRIIDLREKANQILYYPLSEKSTLDGRKSLSAILLDEVKKGKVIAMDPLRINMDTLPTPSVTYSDVEASMGARSTMQQITQLDGSVKDTTIKTRANPDNIKQLMVYEEWFYDKKHSKLDVRIIGICPIWIGMNEATGKQDKKQLFWVRFDDVRDLLSVYEAYNPNNDAQRMSYDDIFMQRRFTSYIFAESNVFSDRQIGEYTLGKDAMFESERVKKSLQDFEHDLWEY